MEFMQAHLRELAGSSKLHISIALQAAYIGRQQLAEQHLSWAEKLDPDDPRLAFIRGTLLIARGDTDGAIRLWRELLTQNPNLPYLRVKLAEVVANQPHRGSASLEDAVSILRPLLDNESVEPGIRLFATSLAATLQHGLGRDGEYRRLLQEFNQLAETTQAPLSQRLVAGLRTNMPHLFPDPRKPGGGSQNGSQPGPQSADIGAFLQNSQSISAWNLAGSVA
jgi:tetratricopeptide (TPR) repeat protein